METQSVLPETVRILGVSKRGHSTVPGIPVWVAALQGTLTELFVSESSSSSSSSSFFCFFFSFRFFVTSFLIKADFSRVATGTSALCCLSDYVGQRSIQ